jgi:hypothetical protein
MANPLRERIARLKKLKNKRFGVRAILAKFGDKKRIPMGSISSFKVSQRAVLRKFGFFK